MREELVLCANVQLWMARDWYYRYYALPASWHVLKVAGLGCTISVGMHKKKSRAVMISMVENENGLVGKVLRGQKSTSHLTSATR